MQVWWKKQFLNLQFNCRPPSAEFDSHRNRDEHWSRLKILRTDRTFNNWKSALLTKKVNGKEVKYED